MGKENITKSIDNILFIYAKKGKIKCYTADQLRGKELQLSLDGWSHTATINPALWIEDMANGDRDPSDILDEIQFVKP
jgi:hypothetical protein